MIRIIQVSAVVGLLVAASLAGCGGGDDEGGDSLTKTEFVEQANAICTDARKEMLKQVSDDGGNVISVTVATLEKEEQEISALGAPSGEERQVNAIVDGIRKTIAAVKANPDTIAPANTQLGKTEDLAEKYGLKACLVS